MKNVLLKTLVLAGHIVVFLLFVEVILLGKYYNPVQQDSLILIINCILSAAILVFAFIYTTSLSESFDQSLPFLSIYLLLLQFSLILFADSNLVFFNIVTISQITITEIIIFCAMGMSFMLCGYGLFSHQKSKETINIFLFTTIVTAIAFAKLMPKIQGVFDFWTGSAMSGIFTLFSFINVIIFTALLVSDPIGTQTIRNVFGLILTVFTWAFFSFKSEVVCITGISFLVLSFVTVTVLCRKYSAKL